MGIKVVDNGNLRDSDNVSLAEKVLKLRQTKDHWAVIDLLVKAWAQRAPDEEKAMKVQIEEYKDMLADSKYGQTKGGKDFERRFTIAFPQRLMLMIRTQYKPTELVMDSKFYREFARRYPAFQIPDKL